MFLLFILSHLSLHLSTHFHSFTSLPIRNVEASVRRVQFSWMWTVCSPLPSAARRLANGIAQPFAFLQFEVRGGIFHSCSFTVVFRLGECMTGQGGEGGAQGIFLLILNLGGSIGSFCISTIRMPLCFAPELKAPPCGGVCIEYTEQEPVYQLSNWHGCSNLLRYRFF